MKANDWRAFQKRDDEREELTDTLNRDAREVQEYELI
jgi:hypothetical protein